MYEISQIKKSTEGKFYIILYNNNPEPAKAYTEKPKDNEYKSQSYVPC